MIISPKQKLTVKQQMQLKILLLKANVKFQSDLNLMKQGQIWLPPASAKNRLMNHRPTAEMFPVLPFTGKTRDGMGNGTVRYGTFQVPYGTRQYREVPFFTVQGKTSAILI